MAEMFFYVFFVCAGCLLGIAARCLATRTGRGFPWLTPAVEAACCFFTGVFWGMFSRSLSEASQILILLSVGFMGGFTPPHIAVKESMRLLRDGRYRDLALYAIGGIALAAAAALAGFALAG